MPCRICKMYPLQGFQLIADDLGGWGHATAELLQGIQDEYAGSPVLLWAARRQATCGASPHTVSCGKWTSIGKPGV